MLCEKSCLVLLCSFQAYFGMLKNKKYIEIKYKYGVYSSEKNYIRALIYVDLKIFNNKINAKLINLAVLPRVFITKINDK